MKNNLIILLIFISISPSFSQIGGDGINDFLNLPASARATAMGGILIGIKDYDVSNAFSNPALLNEEMNRGLAFSQQFHFADINASHANYAWKLPWENTMMHAGFHLLNYGDFTESDIYGNTYGNFSAKDVAAIVGVSKSFDEKLSIGVNLKYFNSIYESYSSSGIGIDVGAHYIVAEKNMSFSAVIKNLDVQFSSFNDREYARPDLQLAITKRLSHLPFQFSIIGHNLHQWSIRYEDPNAPKQTDILGEVQDDSQFKKNVDNMFRHLIFSGEFLFGKKENLKLRLAYNHMRRQELSVTDFKSLAGFSGGLGIKIKGFRIEYGIAYYHLVGSSKQLTISTNLNNFRKNF